ncbi:MAG: hypothetical protein VX185_02215 [Pseudomonadota bacterium]|nr:hypothetical protein [Pseudomonadota bacterium]
MTIDNNFQDFAHNLPHYQFGSVRERSSTRLSATNSLNTQGSPTRSSLQAAPLRSAPQEDHVSQIASTEAESNNEPQSPPLASSLFDLIFPSSTEQSGSSSATEVNHIALKVSSQMNNDAMRASWLSICLNLKPQELYNKLVQLEKTATPQGFNFFIKVECLKSFCENIHLIKQEYDLLKNEILNKTFDSRVEVAMSAMTVRLFKEKYGKKSHQAQQARNITTDILTCGSIDFVKELHEMMGVECHCVERLNNEIVSNPQYGNVGSSFKGAPLVIHYTEGNEFSVSLPLRLTQTQQDQVGTLIIGDNDDQEPITASPLQIPETRTLTQKRGIDPAQLGNIYNEYGLSCLKLLQPQVFKVVIGGTDMPNSSRLKKKDETVIYPKTFLCMVDKGELVHALAQKDSREQYSMNIPEVRDHYRNILKDWADTLKNIKSNTVTLVDHAQYKKPKIDRGNELSRINVFLEMSHRFYAFEVGFTESEFKRFLDVLRTDVPENIRFENHNISTVGYIASDKIFNKIDPVNSADVVKSKLADNSISWADTAFIETAGQEKLREFLPSLETIIEKSMEQSYKVYRDRSPKITMNNSCIQKNTSAGVFYMHQLFELGINIDRFALNIPTNSGFADLNHDDIKRILYNHAPFWGNIMQTLTAERNKHKGTLKALSTYKTKLEKIRDSGEAFNAEKQAKAKKAMGYEYQELVLLECEGSGFKRNLDACITDTHQKILNFFYEDLFINELQHLNNTLKGYSTDQNLKLKPLLSFNELNSRLYNDQLLYISLFRDGNYLKIKDNNQIYPVFNAMKRQGLVAPEMEKLLSERVFSQDVVSEIQKSFVQIITTHTFLKHELLADIFKARSDVLTNLKDLLVQGARDDKLLSEAPTELDPLARQIAEANQAMTGLLPVAPELTNLAYRHTDDEKIKMAQLKALVDMFDDNRKVLIDTNTHKLFQNQLTPIQNILGKLYFTSELQNKIAALEKNIQLPNTQTRSYQSTSVLPSINMDYSNYSKRIHFFAEALVDIHWQMLKEILTQSSSYQVLQKLQKFNNANAITPSFVMKHNRLLAYKMMNLLYYMEAERTERKDLGESRKPTSGRHFSKPSVTPNEYIDFVGRDDDIGKQLASSISQGLEIGLKPSDREKFGAPAVIKDASITQIPRWSDRLILSTEKNNAKDDQTITIDEIIRRGLFKDGIERNFENVNLFSLLYTTYADK